MRRLIFRSFNIKDGARTLESSEIKVSFNSIGRLSRDEKQSRWLAIQAEQINVSGATLPAAFFPPSQPPPSEVMANASIASASVSKKPKSKAKVGRHRRPAKNEVRVVLSSHKFRT